MLIAAIIFITSALIFYTIGVWSEKIQGNLTYKHLIFFILGFACDTTGTMIMEKIASAKEVVATGVDIHGITGMIALGLMFVHGAWAALVLYKGNEQWKKKFHTFSIIVWLIWLVPFLNGAMAHM